MRQKIGLMLLVAVLGVLITPSVLNGPLLPVIADSTPQIPPLGPLIVAGRSQTNCVVPSTTTPILLIIGPVAGASTTNAM